MATYAVNTWVETLEVYDGWEATLFAGTYRGDRLQSTELDKHVIATQKHPDSESEAVRLLLKGFLGAK